MSRLSDRSRLSKLSLVVGYLALLAATVSAYGAPATGYELSVYAATPGVFWVGVAAALAVSLGVALTHTESPTLRDTALVLGGLSVLSVVVLPAIRGYYHYGSGDSLSHAGWARDILAGRLDPVGMLYPGIHTMTIFASELLGVRVGQAQLVVLAAFVAVFLLCTAQCVSFLGQSRYAVPVGAFAALLLLPNNNVSVHLMAHPITQSLLFSPLILYLTLRYVSASDDGATGRAVATPMGVALVVASFALILVHPQGALNVLGVLLAVAAFQFAARRVRPDSRVADHRPVYVPTVVAAVAFAVWAPRHPRVQRTIDTVLTRVLQGSTPADEISQRSGSLELLGADILGLFVKLFLVSAVFSLLAGLLALALSRGYLSERRVKRNALLSYVVVALVPLSAAFLVFFVSSMTTQHFRYVGFVMVPITVLGAMALSMSAERLRSVVGDRSVQLGLVVVFLLLFPFPLATVHGGPFIYQPTSDVTKMELSGTNATVEYMDRDVAFAGVRGGPRRQVDATRGTVGSERLGLRGERAGIPEGVFASNVTTYYDSPRYVPVSRSDYQREVVLYDGFRYPERGFERLRTTPGSNRVHTNGGYRLYLLTGE